MHAITTSFIVQGFRICGGLPQSLRDRSLKEGASVPVSRRDYKWVEDPAVTPADMAY